MSGNKASYYRLPTKSELNSSKTPMGKPTNLKVLTKENVYWAIDQLRQRNPNFDNLTTSMALNEVEKFLEDTGYKDIITSGNSITGPDGATFYIKKARSNSGFAVRDKK